MATASVIDVGELRVAEVRSGTSPLWTS